MKGVFGIAVSLIAVKDIIILALNGLHFTYSKPAKLLITCALGQLAIILIEKAYQ